MVGREGALAPRAMSVITEPTRAPADQAGSNARGIAAMLLAMACFSLGDTAIKLAGRSLPVGEMMLMRGVLASIVIFSIARAMGALVQWRSVFTPLVGLRTICDAGATICFFSGLVTLPFADAAAIAQFTPLAVTALAAIVLAEPVGWRRWLATSVGLVGVLIIIQPGTSTFDWAAIWIVASVLFVALRDVVTRKMGASVHPVLLTAVSALAVAAVGLAVAPTERWVLPATGDVALMALAAVSALAGQYSIIVAMRSGEVAVVGPFRYSVILFAVLSGMVVFGETLTAWTVLGIVIVVAAGIYTFHRESVRRREAKVAARAGPGA